MAVKGNGTYKASQLEWFTYLEGPAHNSFKVLSSRWPAVQGTLTRNLHNKLAQGLCWVPGK